MKIPLATVPLQADYFFLRKKSNHTIFINPRHIWGKKSIEVNVLMKNK